MDYSKLCAVYERLEGTTKGLEKTSIVAEFLKSIKNFPEAIYLLQGKVFPDYDTRELGLSEQLVIKAIAKTGGVLEKEVTSLFKKLGDLGLVAEEIISKKKQTSLFSKKLKIEDVLRSLRKIAGFEGGGSIESKINSVVELLHNSSPKEARYIVRTVLGDLKVGVGSGILRDGIVEFCFNPKSISEKKKLVEVVQEAYDKTNDFAEVFIRCLENSLDKIKLSPGRPVKVMLFPKAKDISDAFRIVGKPAAFEYKYDGFRMVINKDNKDNVKIFTRRLENVTKQFPDVVSSVLSNVSAKSFIIDSEAVGYDKKSGKYTPFQAISQRIKRKYGIEKMAAELPIELVVFDIIFLNGKNLIDTPFEKRRKLLEKIVKQKKKKIVLAKQIITDREEVVEKFYAEAISNGQEGLMGKNLKAPYKPGSRVGYAVKLKPKDRDFDLVITGAEWGTGKRAGWLTSFDVSCRDGEKLLAVGKVSTGLKELSEEGLSFEEMTKILKKLIISESGRHVKIKPRIVVSVQFQNIQKSPTYESGYALRFPRINALRPDRGIYDIATLKDIKSSSK
ncbi:ATP-dependent DNA ligase [Candidatus Pacearchaeota archaeon]|nr:MAG: ATP-dependent DNA ligase [Candidatus Pacearchaeota archaeon]